MSAEFRQATVPGLLPGNCLHLLQSGVEYFPALLAAIDGARFEVHLETYIFEDDATGRSVADALQRAVRRRVAVRVLVDGFGARGFAAGLGAALASAGAEVLTYRPESGRLAIRRYRLRRLHRKLSVIDGATAFVGGINVVDDFDAGDSGAPRFDYAVRLEGPLVAHIHQTMRELWRLVRWAYLGHRPPPPPPPPAMPAACGSMPAALRVRDNLRHRRDIEDAYLAAIGMAHHEIVIANAYFLPGRRFTRELLAAARRGVRVRLLLQGRPDHLLLHYATQALYGRMLGAGVRVFEYAKAHLHAKVAVIDDEWATVGSSNIDPFSLLLAREANVVVRDAGFATNLRASLETAMADSAREIDPGDQRRRGLLPRLASLAAYALVRLLLGVTRYGRREYAD